MPKQADALSEPNLEPVPEDVRQRVAGLVDHFNRHLGTFSAPDYKEDQLCREFIDPLFSALGWDMENKAQLAPEWREVIREDTQRTGEGTKAPDYAFKAGRERDFFVEAKRPSINMKTDPEPARQLRRYGWNAGMAVSILTDFQEFAVYDCREKPKLGMNEKMLTLNQQLPKAKTPGDRDTFQRQITGTSAKIDRLVYKLYGLTDEEIKIVEDG